LSAALTTGAGALKRVAIHGLLRKRQIAVAFVAPGAGTLTMQLTTTGRHPIVIAGGRVGFVTAGKRTLVLALTKKGLNLLRHAGRLNATLVIRFVARGGASSSLSLRVSLRR
jgi:hypothetical protein